MQNTFGWILYVLFAANLFVIYLSIRRRWATPGVVAAAGTIGSIVIMVLIAIAQGNSALQAVVVGIFVGGLFSGVTLAVAWYFQTNELRARYGDGFPPMTGEAAPPPQTSDEDY